MTDRWGTWVSAWTPIYDEHGRLDAVLGVDFAAKEWESGIAAARRGHIALLAVLLVLLGSAAFINGMLRADIDKRQRTEDDLRRSQGRLALRAEQTPLALIEWDLDLKVTDWNAAAERLFGYSRSEAVGAPMLELIAPESVRAEIAALRDGNPHRETLRTLHRRTHRARTAARSSARGSTPRSWTAIASSASLHFAKTSPSGANSRSNFARRKRWKPSASSPAASRTISTTCSASSRASPISSALAPTCPPTPSPT